MSGGGDVVALKTPFPALRRDYFGDRRFRNSGVRTGPIRKLVIHTAEGCKTAKCVAEFFLKPDVLASTHAAVDASGISGQLMLPEHTIPWGASGANRDGWHLELCGFAKWTTSEWMAHEKMLQNAAWRFALRAVWNDIPVRHIPVSKSFASAKGITTHADVNAFFKNGDHRDPGPNVPMPHFLNLVQGYVDLIKGVA
jgi:hypothetical protein